MGWCEDCQLNSTECLEGLMVCTRCHVIAGRFVSEEAEWRCAEGNRAGPEQRVGLPEDLELSTRIDTTDVVLGAQSEDYRNYMWHRKELSKLCQRLNVSRFCELVYELFGIYREATRIIRTPETLYVALVYHAHLLNQNYYPLARLCEASGNMADPLRVLRVWRYLLDLVVAPHLKLNEDDVFRAFARQLVNDYRLKPQYLTIFDKLLQLYLGRLRSMTRKAPEVLVAGFYYYVNASPEVLKQLQTRFGLNEVLITGLKHYLPGLTGVRQRGQLGLRRSHGSTQHA